MQLKAAPSLVALLFLAIAIAGCSGTQNAAVTPVQTPVSVSTPSSPSVSGGYLVPSPTDVIVDSRKVSFNVEKDYLGNVVVTFQGGSGLVHVRKIDVTLNRADGQVKTATVGINLGDTATLEGTKDTDRVIVHVTMDDGKTSKLVDTLSSYKTRS